MEPTLIYKAGMDVYEVRHTKNPLLNIILFHGYGANAKNLISLASYLDTDRQYNWFFPEAILSLEEQLGMSNARAWFPIDFAQLTSMDPRDYTSFLPDGFVEGSARILKLLEALALENCVMGGFSQGAMMAVDVAIELILNASSTENKHTEVINSSSIKGLLLYSGTIIDQLRWKSSLSKKNINGSKPIPFLQSHGRMDPLLQFSISEKLFTLLDTSSYFNGTFYPFGGAHEIPSDALDQTQLFLDLLARDPS